jgi:UDP-hydrolysing UDP-N-acetyl-D-glucosamine 2-epimerase
VIVTARPSWAKLQTLCEALSRRDDVELQIVACASALLERYGAVVNVIKEKFDIAAECWTVHEGENLITSAKETGALLVELAGTLSRLRSDVVVVCADRHEVLAAAQAAAYLHLPLLHMQGGERSQSIDDKVRDAITQLADYHMVCTRRAQMRVYALTGDHERVIWTGCPSIDLAKQALTEPPVTSDELGGAGAPIDLTKPFVVVLQHPVTSEAEHAGADLDITILAALAIQPQVLCLWPGQDAGAGLASKALRGWQDRVHTVRSLRPSRFLRLLTQSACLIGNSSAGIRECGYLGVPVVNVGTRQHGRERAAHVLDVPHGALHIANAIESQIAHGPYPSSMLYGHGNSGQRIAEVLIERVCADTSKVS